MQETNQSSFGKTLGLVPGSVVYVGKKTAGDLHIEVFDYDKTFFEGLDRRTYRYYRVLSIHENR